jgi:toxin ParE1/3/4
LRLVISALARRDQDDISRYTLEQWAKPQLLAYVGGLLYVLDSIASGTTVGKSVRGIPPRFLRVTYQSHFIFYTTHAETVRIVRILHQRMDHARHLN